jgi:hypothetical protein
MKTGKGIQIPGVSGSGIPFKLDKSEIAFPVESLGNMPVMLVEEPHYGLILQRYRQAMPK